MLIIRIPDVQMSRSQLKRSQMQVHKTFLLVSKLIYCAFVISNPECDYIKIIKRYLIYTFLYCVSVYYTMTL